MAEFLTTANATSEIEKLINSARGRLVLICPFVKIPENLFQNLKVADKRGVKITLVYGKDEMKPEERKKLESLENLSLYFLENLHAKCFFNEEVMVITSFNLLQSSLENREMGVLVNAKDDPTCFRDAREEAERIVSSATKDELKGPKYESYPYSAAEEGYCIRCRTSIKRDLEKPLCSNCFSEWVQWANPDYEEEFCHQCGKSAATTIVKPLCYSCYNKLRR